MSLEMLIAAVAEHPVLYDLTLFAYRDQLKTADAWKKVAIVVGLPDSECKKKWKYLRGQLRKEKKKEKDRRRSGAAASKVKPWRYAAIMAFLNPFLEDRSTSSNMEGEDSESEDQEEDDEDQEQEQNDEQLQPTAATSAGRSAEQACIEKRRLTGNEFEERMLLALEAVSNRPPPPPFLPPPPEEDNDSLFLKSLLKDFRTLSFQTREQLKFDFYRQVYEAKLREGPWVQGNEVQLTTL
ncbi:Transcription factor Adf-1 [Merluccius polli]|uniref:Transcription factor Adf-1 n=1 Tax=Merluccius polli TaxID=89951 RepID=A0AA47M4D1_MERPO|nr:Transcription factor Adf-1 [Merluccius polli]